MNKQDYLNSIKTELKERFLMRLTTKAQLLDKLKSNTELFLAIQHSDSNSDTKKTILYYSDIAIMLYAGWDCSDDNYFLYNVLISPTSPALPQFYSDNFFMLDYKLYSYLSDSIKQDLKNIVNNAFNFNSSNNDLNLKVNLQFFEHYSDNNSDTDLIFEQLQFYSFLLAIVYDNKSNKYFYIFNNCVIIKDSKNNIYLCSRNLTDLKMHQPVRASDNVLKYIKDSIYYSDIILKNKFEGFCKVLKNNETIFINNTLILPLNDKDLQEKMFLFKLPKISYYNL